MKSRSVLLAFAMSFSCVPAADADGLQPESVMAVASAQGGLAALKKYFSCDAAGEQAYALVASGSKAWLEVAVALLPSADACYTESLHDSIARALVRQPANVLPLVDSAPTLRAPSVCIPFLPAEDPKSQRLSYLDHEEAVLRSVHVPSLEAAKQACLGQVQATRAAIGG